MEQTKIKNPVHDTACTASILAGLLGFCAFGAGLGWVDLYLNGELPSQKPVPSAAEPDQYKDLPPLPNLEGMSNG